MFLPEWTTLSNILSTIVRACLNETLRLFPPVPSNTRSSAVETVLHTSDVNLDGTQKIVYMPGSGVPLRYSPMLMQRRKDLWGEDSLEFVPERWIDPKRVQEMTADPFKFIPFNAGPRICLGQVRQPSCLNLTTLTIREFGYPEFRVQ